MLPWDRSHRTSVSLQGMLGLHTSSIPQLSVPRNKGKTYKASLRSSKPRLLPLSQEHCYGQLRCHWRPLRHQHCLLPSFPQCYSLAQNQHMTDTHTVLEAYSRLSLRSFQQQQQQQQGSSPFRGSSGHVFSFCSSLWSQLTFKSQFHLHSSSAMTLPASLL